VPNKRLTLGVKGQQRASKPSSVAAVTKHQARASSAQGFERDDLLIDNHELQLALIFNAFAVEICKKR
jgi:hypothetical protein